MSPNSCRPLKITCGSGERGGPCRCEMSSSLSIFFLPRLFSNSFASGDGFQLKYESSNVSHWNYSSGACGGSFSTPNGIITSPSYPGPVPRGVDSYGRGIDCGYTISRPAGTVIVLNFLSMNLHKPKISCSHRDTDYVHKPERRPMHFVA